MRERLEGILKSALEEIGASSSKEALENARIKYLGKKGELTSILRGMGALSAEERPAVGQLANDVRAKIEKAIEDASSKAAQQEMMRKIQSETIDVTMPGAKIPLGKKHPITIVLDEI